MQSNLNRTLKAQFNETMQSNYRSIPVCKIIEPEPIETYFNSEALWKRTQKTLERQRHQYVKICRGKRQFASQTKSQFINEITAKIKSVSAVDAYVKLENTTLSNFKKQDDTEAD